MAISTVRDNAHAAWIGYQPPATPDAFVTPAVPMCWLTAPPRFAVNRPLAKPELQRLNSWDHIEEFDTTSEVTITDEGVVDSNDFGYTLMSVYGADTYSGTGVHDFLPGAVGTANPRPLLSMQICTGSYDVTANKWEVYQFRNVRTTSVNVRFDPTLGVLMYRATRLAIYVGKALVDPPTFTPAGNPFANAAVLIKRETVTVSPILTGSMTMTSDARSIFGSPASAGAGAIAATRLTEGKTGITADFVYDSGTGAGINQSFDDFLAGTERSWAILASASAHVLNILIPRLKSDTGEIDPTNDDTRQHIAGDGIYKSATGSGAAVTLTGPKLTAYNS
jgi:hypothetical protein